MSGLSDSIKILPRGPIDATVVPPGSKSLTNRALLIAALAKGESVLDGVLDSDDTRIMFEALRTLGFSLDHDPKHHRMRVLGLGGSVPETAAELDVGNSGTTARFLTAALALAKHSGEVRYRIFGKERMHQRPIRDLIAALKPLGGNLRCENADGCPPVLIGRNPYGQTDWNTPGSEGRPIVASVAGNVSSQFLSALMIAAPLISSRNDVVLKIEGTLVSFPYIAMTASIMHSFGVECHFFDPKCDSDGGLKNDSDCTPLRFSRGGTITIPQGSAYSARNYAIEPDASAASYFFAAAAVCGGRVTVRGLNKDSLQGDVGFVECLRQMGCEVEYSSDAITLRRELDRPLRGITVDMNPISDTVQTLAVVALFAEGPTRIVNAKHIRYKETDRIAALAAELRKLGAVVEEFEDGLSIVPPRERQFAEIDTYDDHRMGMSFAIAGLREPGIVIRDPKCTEKTYPRFFEDLDRL